MKASPARCELAAGPLGSLRERFAHVTEFRKGQGKRHRLPTVLAIVACAKMAGVMGGYGGLASYAKNLTRPQRRALHCWINEKTGEHEVPSESCLRVLQGSRRGGRIRDAGLAGPGAGTQYRSVGGDDGKTLKHSGCIWSGPSACSSHRCLGVEPVADKSNEIPAVQKLLERAPILPGQMVSLDALHTQHKTVAQILYDKGADYLLPIKGNQETL